MIGVELENDEGDLDQPWEKRDSERGPTSGFLKYEPSRSPRTGAHGQTTVPWFTMFPELWGDFGSAE